MKITALAGIILTSLPIAVADEKIEYQIPERLPQGFSIRVLGPDTNKPLNIEFTDAAGAEHVLDARTYHDRSEFLAPLGTNHGLTEFQIKKLQKRAEQILSDQPEWEITYPDKKRYPIDIDRQGAEFVIQFDPTYHDYLKGEEMFEGLSPGKQSEFNNRGRRFFNVFREHASRYWIGQPEDGNALPTMGDLIQDMRASLPKANPQPIQEHIKDSYGLDVSIFEPR